VEQKEAKPPIIIINDYCIRFNNRPTGAESLHFLLFFSLSLSDLFPARKAQTIMFFLQSSGTK